MPVKTDLKNENFIDHYFGGIFCLLEIIHMAPIIKYVPFLFSTTAWKSSTAFSMAAINSGEAPPGGKNNSFHDRLYKNNAHYLVWLILKATFDWKVAGCALVTLPQ